MAKVLLDKEVAGFRLIYRYSLKHAGYVMKMESLVGAGHFAQYTRYNALAEDGSIIESRPITEEVAQFIIDNFEIRGSTLSFDIYESDLAAKKILPRAKINVAPEQVRHKLTVAENTFTATGSKLQHHWPIFKKLNDTGYGSIIRATLTLHQVCSSKCHFCSTIARNKKDEISLGEAQEFISKLYFDQAEYNKTNFADYNNLYKQFSGTDIRLKGLILSGGGQPNLWPHFTSFMKWLSHLELDVGLITNGFPKNIPDEVYNHFKWIRISITPEDCSPHYIGGKFNNQRLPETIKNNTNLTVGYSYVYGPWTDDDILLRIRDSMEENGFDYCRLLTDCNLTRSSQLKAHQSLAERLHRLGFITADGTPTGKFFHQLKYHGSPEEANLIFDSGQCFLQAYNVFWDTTGHEESGKSYCYACDSITVLAEEASDNHIMASERKFNHENWGTVANTEVERLFTEPLKPFFDPRKVCTSCLFMKNNQEVKSLKGQQEVLASDLQSTGHVNFP